MSSILKLEWNEARFAALLETGLDWPLVVGADFRDLIKYLPFLNQADPFSLGIPVLGIDLPVWGDVQTYNSSVKGQAKGQKKRHLPIRSISA
jgi:hypothetical protein